MAIGGVLLCAVALLWPAIEIAQSPAADAAEEPVAANAPRVRALDELAAELIADGVRRSATLSQLVSVLQRTDVIVYVHTTVDLPIGCDGTLRFMTAAGGLRYVRASVDATKPRNLMISMIAHELQHALELAGAPDVRSRDGFRALFRKGNMDRPLSWWNDSAEARDVGRRVRRELVGG